MGTEVKETQIDNKLLVKTSLWYTVSNFLSRAMVFLTTPIFTRLLSKKQYADFSIFASWQSVFLIICGLEIYVTLNRFRFDHEKPEEINSFITSSIVLSNLVTTLFLLFYLLFPGLLQKLFLLDTKYILLMFVYLYTYPVFAMFQAKQRIAYQYKLSAAISFLLLLISTGLALFLAHAMEEDRLLGRVIGQYMPYVLAGLVFYTHFLLKSRSIRLKYWKYALTIGLPLVFSFLGSQVLLYSDKVVVRHLSSENEVAWLVLATTASHIMLIFVQTLNFAWSPWFFDKLAAKDYGAIRKTFLAYMLFLMFCTLAVLLAGPELIQILGGREFSESIQLLPAYLVVGGVLTALTAQYVNIETFHKETKYAGILTSIVAVLNVVLDIVAVRNWGYRAACYVTVFCQLLLILLHLVFSRKMDSGRIFPLTSLGIVLLGTLGMIPLSLFLYQHTWLRLAAAGAVVLATVALLVKYRKIILRFLSRRRG